MVHADNIIDGQLNERTSEVKVHVTMCIDFGLNVNWDIIMRISYRTEDMEKIKCNNYI